MVLGASCSGGGYRSNRDARHTGSQSKQEPRGDFGEADVRERRSRGPEIGSLVNRVFCSSERCRAESGPTDRARAKWQMVKAVSVLLVSKLVFRGWAPGRRAAYLFLQYGKWRSVRQLESHLALTHAR